MSEITEMSIEELQTAMLRMVRTMSPAEKAELRAAIRRAFPKSNGPKRIVN
jgi:hypothetical protein